MLLAMVVLPLPPFLLDLFFTFNIALSLVVLLVTVYALRPLILQCFRRCCWSRHCCAWR